MSYLIAIILAEILWKFFTCKNRKKYFITRHWNLQKKFNRENKCHLQRCRSTLTLPPFLVPGSMPASTPILFRASRVQDLIRKLFCTFLTLVCVGCGLRTNQLCVRWWCHFLGIFLCRSRVSRRDYNVVDRIIFWFLFGIIYVDKCGDKFVMITKNIIVLFVR